MDTRTASPGISNIIAALLLIVMVVVGAGVYFIVLQGILRPTVGFQAGVSIVGGGGPGGTNYGDIVISLTDTGSSVINSVVVTIDGPGSTSLVVTSGALRNYGGAEQMTLTGLSGAFSCTTGPTTGLGCSIGTETLTLESGTQYLYSAVASISGGQTYTITGSAVSS
jgi:flagellin-like protein